MEMEFVSGFMVQDQPETRMARREASDDEPCPLNVPGAVISSG
jgi:hypothetical protein